MVRQKEEYHHSHKARISMANLKFSSTRKHSNAINPLNSRMLEHEHTSRNLVLCLIAKQKVGEVITR